MNEVYPSPDLKSLYQEETYDHYICQDFGQVEIIVNEENGRTIKYKTMNTRCKTKQNLLRKT